MAGPEREGLSECLGVGVLGTGSDSEEVGSRVAEETDGPEAAAQLGNESPEEEPEQGAPRAHRLGDVGEPPACVRSWLLSGIS